MKLITRAHWIAIALGFVLTFGSVVSGQSRSDQHARSEQLTLALASLNSRYQGAGPEQSALAAEMLAAAAERQQLLVSMLESDPGQVLRVALPADLRAALPPDVQASIEEHVELEGTLEAFVEDYDDRHRVLYFLQTDAERLSLYFAPDPPGLLSGTRVRVQGVRVNGALALDSSTTSVETLALTTSNTFGEQPTMVLLVNFQDNPIQPYTSGYADSVVFTDTSSFEQENSYGQTWLTGYVFGWFTLPINTTCDSSTIASYANQAAKSAGVNLSAYSRYVYNFPANSACGWGGLGTVGGNPSQAWINGTINVKVGHELGHNFGLYHSHALDCGSTVLGGSCSTQEYGDTLDTMGSMPGHFNSFQKERLGWLDYGTSPSITTVPASGMYQINRYEDGLGPKALKILKSTDAKTGRSTWYYLEFRQPVGFDAFMYRFTNMIGGVAFHLGTDSTPNSSDLLDMTPGTTSWLDPALAVGQTYSDSSAGVTITPMSVSSTGASVSVVFGSGSVSCVPANPTVTVSPSTTQWASPGSAVAYSLSVTNNDSSGCTTNSFSVSGVAPAGWSVTPSASSLTLAPGASATTNVQVAAAVSAADGLYSIPVSGASSLDPTRTGTATAYEMIVSSLTVSVASNAPSYTARQTVTLTAAVSANGAPTAGASVNFTIQKPNGTSVTGSAITDASGIATYQYRLKAKDPTGTYQASASASVNGLTGQATTSFMVK